MLTKHVIEKLEDPTSKRLGGTLDILKTILSSPEVIDNSEYPVMMAVGKLKNSLSLCIVYRITEKGIRIITFFPAKRGRYEGKVLPRR